MPNPKKSLSPNQPLTLPPEISPQAREFFDKMLVIAKDYRMTQLVDYLCDLRTELFWVVDELAALDFDAVEFLELLADGEADDYSDDDGPGPEAVH